MMDRDDSRVAAGAGSEFRGLIKAAAGAPELYTATFLPRALSALPDGDARHVRAREVIAEQHAREAGGRDAVIVERLHLCMRLALLLNTEPTLADVRLVLEQVALPHGGTAAAYLDEVEAATIEDLTPAQRWELLARVFEIDSYCEAGALFNEERTLLGRPIPTTGEEVH